MSRPVRRILGLETSGRIGSLALGDDGGVVAAARLSADMRHASELMPAIEALLQSQRWPGHSLTDVFVSVGPGSFTGSRIGVTIARTFGWSIGARIVAVGTVDCLALNALDADPPPSHLALVLDAKRSQIYTAAFNLAGGQYVKTIDACLAEPRAFFERCGRPLAVLGEGIPHHREAIRASGAAVLDERLWSARAENVIRAGMSLAEEGRFTPPGDLVPLYIRRPEMEERWEQRQRESNASINPSREEH